jgi:hypothetical protein
MVHGQGVNVRATPFLPLLLLLLLLLLPCGHIGDASQSLHPEYQPFKVISHT